MEKIPISASRPIQLSAIQQQVFELLREKQTPQTPLSDWYMGALYALDNVYNPERISQASHSLRELMEKLPRLIESMELIVPKNELTSAGQLKQRREKIRTRLEKDKSEYANQWTGKSINPHLAGTLETVCEYIEKSNRPTGREQIEKVIYASDPMAGTFGEGINREKQTFIKEIQESLLRFTHHNTSSNEELFLKNLKDLEYILIELFAPTTADDQREIAELQSKTAPSNEEVARIKELIVRRGSNYAFFFKTTKNPVWLQILKGTKFLTSPATAIYNGDKIIFQFWWPIHYLRNMAHTHKNEVIEIIEGLEPTDNIRVQYEVFEIAVESGDASICLRLKKYWMAYIESKHKWLSSELIPKLILCLVKEVNSRQEALRLIETVVKFRRDPLSAEKEQGRKENPKSIYTRLEPSPIFDAWEYEQILLKGILPSANYAPLEIAKILSRSVNEMIFLGKNNDELKENNYYDFSRIWCPRLEGKSKDYEGSDAKLVHALISACKTVYDQSPQSFAELEDTLKQYRWKVFTRIRFYLYSLYPGDKILPWIRNEILSYKNYDKHEHSHEFQLMIRKSCEFFERRLLSEAEASIIFASIINGPSQEDFQSRWGEDYSDFRWKRSQRHFHYLQLRPFFQILDDNCLKYFNQLSAEFTKEKITDESYSPVFQSEGGEIVQASPVSLDTLKQLDDKGILDYINNWSSPCNDPDNWLIEISFAGLASIFKDFFKIYIIPDQNRLNFWLGNKGSIAREIYVKAMINAMADTVCEENINSLEIFFNFCNWILDQPNDHCPDFEKTEPSSAKQPNWNTSRRAVSDFIEVCLSKSTEPPISYRDTIGILLKKLCTQFDSNLAQNTSPSSIHDSVTIGINSTRGRSLESLVKFSYWLRKHNANLPHKELEEILHIRFSENTKHPLVFAEYAILGMNFTNIWNMAKIWTTEHKDLFFPQKNIPIWLNSFGAFIIFSLPQLPIYKLLKDNFKLAIQRLADFDKVGSNPFVISDELGQYLFELYILGAFDLNTPDDLLKCFYEKTSSDKRRWSALFNHIGHSLKKTSVLSETIKEKIISFFNWRIMQKEPCELAEFTFWLFANCLDADWRLDSYARILDITHSDDVKISIEIDALNEMLVVHSQKVILCFSKMTDRLLAGNRHFYINTKKLKPILRNGLQSIDPLVRTNAKHAQDNLLKLGYSDLLNIDASECD